MALAASGGPASGNFAEIIQELNVMLSINAGPFALALTHLLLLIALVTATLIEARFARRVHAKKTAVFSLFILGVVAARIAFVLTYFTQYSDAPWKVLDIRDGGFLVWPGIAAAILGGLLIGWRRPEQRRALAFSMTAGLAIWLLGGWLLSSYQQGAPLPQTTLRTLHGEPVSVAEYRGKSVVINLWATWCPPCRREMPVLRDMQLEREDIVFVFVNQAESAQAVSDYLSRQQLVLSNSFLDPEGEFAREVGSAALPTTLFYSSDGRLTGSHMGEMSRASLTHYLDSQTGARSAVSGTSSHRD
ncbi:MULTISPECIES: TlpA disulfide reductase family protein [Pseudomonas syringae group]|uniref:TlpA family protein disulfide reductase n=2 Tax=Pseudomonas syringae group TaxID=136849 RepID=A0AAW4E723_PSESX|nr:MULTISPECIES: TlpA disulfide reductase family protein [Pseudomonas syringae group]MBH0140158.1 TlpA family protein disulfide reductase [Pseudomonas syringae pv. tomato]MBI6695916.1 TlpA family protein disulfide reductase [Pseudomonas syringae]MBI6716877.1 TlpA family protein disulfide reductase [Pseudomonas syringae]MBI6735180.1 TlpA family protein disulfide reductase [Pseudomonas syringae]MBI6843375.1 TlpA family protein disulfide reductase [Pseudomonas syringae]